MDQVRRAPSSFFIVFFPSSPLLSLTLHLLTYILPRFPHILAVLPQTTMSETMKAIVFSEDRKISFADLPIPIAGPSEILVKVLSPSPSIPSELTKILTENYDQKLCQVKAVALNPTGTFSFSYPSRSSIALLIVPMFRLEARSRMGNRTCSTRL